MLYLAFWVGVMFVVSVARYADMSSFLYWVLQGTRASPEHSCYVRSKRVLRWQWLEPCLALCGLHLLVVTIQHVALRCEVAALHTAHVLLSGITTPCSLC